MTSWETITQPKNEGGLGIRRFGMMNKAMLSKQYWRICTNPNLLVSKTLRSKYCPNQDPYLHKPKQHASWIWKNIMTQSHPKLIQGSWRVGRGLTIPINHPAWFSPHPNAPQHLLGQISTVGDLIDQHNACWRTQLITQLYDKRDSDLILSIPIPLIHSNATSDQLIWPYSITGEYQVKKAYDIITHTESSLNPTTLANPNLWKRLWKIKLPLKILTFTWKLLHHAILVRSELNNRGIQCDRTCILCNNANETQDHLFLHCDLARAIWFGADINIRPITDTGTLVEQWLQALILMPNAASCHTTHLHMTLTLLCFFVFFVFLFFCFLFFFFFRGIYNFGHVFLVHLSYLFLSICYKRMSNLVQRNNFQMPDFSRCNMQVDKSL
jgi:hypothetical protein